jgi:hypothetical protein
MSTDGYRSRKFIVTMAAMVSAVVLAALGKMDANTGIVLAAGIAAYNWANAAQAKSEVDNAD